MRNAIQAAIVVAACASCGGGAAVPDGGDAAGSGNAPVVQIVDPQSGATVYTPDGTITVGFAVANFTLMPAGQCAGVSTCGRAQLTVDGQSCGSAAATMSLTADLNQCTPGMVVGPHTFTVGLINDNDSSVPGASSTVTASVTMQRM
jgi:hypothetical protein